MIKSRIGPIVIIIMLACFSVRIVSAQESLSEAPPEIDLIIDEVLDQVEQEEFVIEPEVLDVITEGVSLNAENDIEVLDEVNMNKEVMDEVTLETKVIPLLHAEASSIIETLEDMKSAQGSISYNGEDRTLILKDNLKQLEAMSAFVKKVDILLETQIFKLKYIKAQEALEAVRAKLTKSVGQARSNQEQNSIVATDTPLVIGAIAELIEKLDYMNREFQFETKILKVILNDEHIDGVDWEAIVSDHARFPLDDDGEETNDLHLGAVTSEDYAILLEALDTVGIVQVVDDDMINTPDKISQIVSVPFEADSSDDLVIKFPVEFLLTPMINENETISVLIAPQLENSKIDSFPQNAVDRTKIEIESGSTIVIGSLFNEVMVESSWKIPLLGDLPILGFVFRNQGEIARKAEIIVFITVEVVEKKSKRSPVSQRPSVP